MTAAVEPFIRLAGVSKTYRSGRKQHLAISDASFDVMPGELVSLVGPSGCGKSTLLKILAGLHGHDDGTVRIGSATHPFDPARDIGMVFQAPLLLKWRRILDNVLLPAELLGLPMREARERAREPPEREEGQTNEVGDERKEGPHAASLRPPALGGNVRAPVEARRA